MIIEKRQEVGKKGKQESREDKSIYIYIYEVCMLDRRTDGLPALLYIRYPHTYIYMYKLLM